MATKPKLTDTEREVLKTVRERMAQVAAMPDPPAWRHWEAEDVRLLRACGPRYAPAEWFGGGESLPEKVRVRYLRAIYKLIDANLLEGTAGEGGRLTWLKLTAAGEAAIGKGK